MWAHLLFQWCGGIFLVCLMVLGGLDKHQESSHEAASTLMRGVWAWHLLHLIVFLRLISQFSPDFSLHTIICLMLLLLVAVAH